MKIKMNWLAILCAVSGVAVAQHAEQPSDNPCDYKTITISGKAALSLAAALKPYMKKEKSSSDGVDVYVLDEAVAAASNADVSPDSKSRYFFYAPNGDAAMKDSAGAKIVWNVLSHAGVYGEGGMSKVVYGAKSIRCTPPKKGMVECTLSAILEKDCG